MTTWCNLPTSRPSVVTAETPNFSACCILYTPCDQSIGAPNLAAAQSGSATSPCTLPCRRDGGTSWSGIYDPVKFLLHGYLIAEARAKARQRFSRWVAQLAQVAR